MDRPPETSRILCEGFGGNGNGSNGGGSVVGQKKAEQDLDSYFGASTAVLLVAGKAEPNDDNVFQNDVIEMKQRLLSLGIREKNIFSVLPEDKGKHLRNIKRAVEDLIEMTFDNFIFFYSGHCSKLHNFSLSGDLLSVGQLKEMLRPIPVKKMLLILDSCFSGGLDVDAVGRGGGEEASGGSTEGGRSRSREIPCLWDIFDNAGDIGRGGNGSGDNGAVDQSRKEDRQAVQWCSCPSDDVSYNHGDGKNGVFTKGILTYVDKMRRGVEVSVLEMHNRVKEDIKKRQDAVLKPDWACDESSVNLRKFPRFRKILDDLIYLR